MGCLAETKKHKKTPKYAEDHTRFQRVVQAIKTPDTPYVKKISSQNLGQAL
ncbi:MAG: hypothetical protein O7F12_05620 [Nitrospirae bacterium]|nr:hypothetical protein [Nitrospirota bacterium]